MHSIARLSKSISPLNTIALPGSSAISSFSTATVAAQKNYNLFRKNY